MRDDRTFIEKLKTKLLRLGEPEKKTTVCSDLMLIPQPLIDLSHLRRAFQWVSGNGKSS